jgi:iron complex outermembrane receptor protein
VTHVFRSSVLSALSVSSVLAAGITTNAPIVVTASRADRTMAEMPANVTVITADRIRDTGAQNAVEALEKLGGLYFRRNADNPGQAAISMRGFGDNSHGRVLVLVDGQPLNTPDMAALDWLRIPVSAVDRIEIVSGGQSALYGNSAEAGVVNILTRRPAGQPVTTASLTVGSEGTFAGHLGHAGSIDDSLRYTADADWLKSDGWRDNSEYENRDVRASIAKDWTERFSTDLSVFGTENHFGMPGALTLSAMRQNPRQTTHPGDEVETTTVGGRLGVHGLVGADGRLDAGLAATHRTVKSDFPSVPSFLETTLDTITFTPRYVLDADLAGHRNKLLAGADLGYDLYPVKAYGDALHAFPNTDATLRRLNAGIYAQDEFWMTDALALTLGARGEIFRYTADVTDFTAIPPSSTNFLRVYRQSALDAAILYRPAEWARVYARAATLYRGPFVDELTSTYGGVPGTPGMNLNLRPEAGQQYELGAHLELDAAWAAALSVYRLDLRNEIAYDPLTWGNSNLPRTRRYGAEASLTWRKDGVGLCAVSYNVVNAAFAAGPYEHKQIPLVPAHVVTVRGELDLPLDLAALATLRGVSAQYLGNDNGHMSPTIPPYATLDLGLRYTPRPLAGFELFAGVDNVADHHYANVGYDYGAPFFTMDYYYPAAGRTWKVSATYRF